MSSPINTLLKANGSKIKAVLKNGIKYEGRLAKSDNFGNLLITEVEEVTNLSTIRYPKAFVRGNNILFIQIL